jgi:CO/xanthine dehydrogenase FAD-binding subunit
VTIVAYHAPEELADAAELLARHGEGVAVLSGGTLLVPELSRPLAPSRIVLDLRRLDVAHGLATEPVLTVGAAVTYGQLMRSPAAAALPVLAAAAWGITGGEQIRNQGTVGGSACQANPSSDVPGCLVAHDAAMLLHGPLGDRVVAARDFFVDAFATTRRSDELLVAMRFRPLRPGTRAAYRKFKLAESSVPIATASVIAEPGADVRVVVGAAVPRPLELRLDPAVLGASDAEAIQEVRQCVAGALDAPWGDILADAEYRAAIAPVVAARAVLDARRAEARP